MRNGYEIESLIFFNSGFLFSNLLCIFLSLYLLYLLCISSLLFSGSAYGLID